MTDGSGALFDDAAVPGPATCLSARGPFGAFPETLPHAGEERERTCASSDADEEQMMEISPLAVLEPEKLRQVQAQRLSGCDALGAPLPPVPEAFALEPSQTHHDAMFPAQAFFDHSSVGEHHGEARAEPSNSSSSNSSAADDSGAESDSEDSSSRTSCDAVEMEEFHVQQHQQEEHQQEQEGASGTTQPSGDAGQAPPPFGPHMLGPPFPVSAEGLMLGDKEVRVLPNLTLCLRCLTRLEDMERSPGFGCKKGARLFKQNWVVSHKKCFGACQCDDFCVSHGYPVDQCMLLHQGATHKVTRYFGQWSDASTKNANPRMHNGNLVPPSWSADPDLLSQQQQQQQQQPMPSPPPLLPPMFPGPPSQKRSRGNGSSDTVAVVPATAVAASSSATTATSLTSSSPSPLAVVPQVTPRRARTTARPATQHRLEGQSAYLVPCAGRPAIEYSPTFPCDCCTRLSRLLAVHWIESSLDLVAALRQRVEASKTRCLGFCQSCYLCRLHCAPAIINEGRHPSRYQCLVDDHESTPKGRHHADFLFYCDRPSCCNGKWFARDETHARTLRKRGITHTDAVRPLTATEERLFAESRRAAPTVQLAIPSLPPAAALSDAEPSAPSIETVLGANSGNNIGSGCNNNSSSSSTCGACGSSVTVSYDRLLGAGKGGGKGKGKGDKDRSKDGERGERRRRRTLSLAAFTCRARVAVALTVCVVAAAVLGAVLATRRSASALGTTELQMCWSLAWSGASGRVSTQGCRVCARNGTTYLCRSDEAPRMLILEAALSTNRFFLQHVRLHATQSDTLETANAILPWTFSSTTTAAAGALAQTRDSNSSSSSNNSNSTGILPDVWYGFILAVGT